MDIPEQIEQLFEKKGGEAYFGEDVTQLEHALQAAWMAEQEEAPDSLVVAALLHDIGHLLHDLPETIADQGVDTRHEELGNAWLKDYFGDAVCEPVKLHVAAKRYLCATDAVYLEQLSAASRQSLALQGGPMSRSEVNDFEANPFYRAAVGLRRWDDRAKISGLAVPGLEHYRARVKAAQL